MAINRELLKSLKSKHSPQVFFETGFYHGYSSEYAFEEGFSEVYSIELLSKFANMGKEKFSKEISEGRMNIILDDSANLRSHISGILDKKVLFWFDAHLDNGTSTAVKTPESKCPVIQEIEALSDFLIKPIILVDDISIITGDSPHTIAWGDPDTSLKKILKAINSLPFEYEISYADNVGVKNDILVAV
jgi:hypothetical protein